MLNGKLNLSIPAQYNKRLSDHWTLTTFWQFESWDGVSVVVGYMKWTEEGDKIILIPQWLDFMCHLTQPQNPREVHSI